MSYNKRSPCQRYFDKSGGKDNVHKSLSATRFAPFRRSSDTTSDSGSDDFKLEPAEDASSSFSRSSSESFSYNVNTRYQGILKDLNEIGHHDHDNRLEQNESLDDFRSRLNMRRKIKTREVTNAYQDDDRTDNSCDSTTTKAHEEILRNANLLKQEKVESDDGFSSKKLYHKEIYYQRFNKSGETSKSLENNQIINEFDKILHLKNDDSEDQHKMVDFEQMHYQDGPSISSSNNSIARSLTENFLVKGSSSKAKSSPRFRRKPHSQVLKAASSIPSLIFSNKSFKQKSSSHLAFEPEPSHKFDSSSKKNSMDDDIFQMSVTKARRSPLRFIGNFVDDKIFRGRWGTTKRAKSTDEITWALANEELEHADLHSSSVLQPSRKKSLGIFPTSSQTSEDKKNFKSSSEKYKTIADIGHNKSTPSGFSGTKKDSNFNRARSIFMDLSKRKSSNTSSDIVTISDSSLNSLNDKYSPGPKSAPNPTTSEIRAETLAEIEAFEELLKNHLQN